MQSQNGHDRQTFLKIKLKKTNVVLINSFSCGPTGIADNAVNVIKPIKNKTGVDQTDPYLSLLVLRNTHSQDIEFSVVQRILGGEQTLHHLSQKTCQRHCLLTKSDNSSNVERDEKNTTTTKESKNCHNDEK